MISLIAFLGAAGAGTGAAGVGAGWTGVVSEEPNISSKSSKSSLRIFAAGSLVCGLV